MSILIFAIGAIGYGGLELLSRGYTHWSMMLTGGACLLSLYYLNILFKAPILIKAAAGALVITIYEFSVGLIVNIWFKWYIWDYHDKFANILGQICPFYTFIWFLLTLGLILISKALCRSIRSLLL